jgi:hypothetical protein
MGTVDFNRTKLQLVNLRRHMPFLHIPFTHPFRTASHVNTTPTSVLISDPPYKVFMVREQGFTLRHSGYWS